MSAQFSPAGVTADDLLVLLAVARSGRYTTAARQLGVTHTTVARRIEALELALGARAIVRGSSGWRLTPLGERAALGVSPSPLPPPHSSLGPSLSSGEKCV